MNKLKLHVLGIVCLISFFMLMPYVEASPSPFLIEYWNTGATGAMPFYEINWLAQTFTTPYSHNISFVKLKLFRTGSPGTVNASIRATSNGKPTGSDLLSSSLNGNTFTTSSSGIWYSFVFSTDYIIDSNTKYAIVIRAPSGDGANFASWLDTGANLYTGGSDCQSVDSGANWFEITSNDYMFEVWGEAKYTFTFRGLFKEDEGVFYPEESRAINVTAHFIGAVEETFVVNGTYNFNSSTTPLYFSFDTIGREYWVSPTELTATIYIFNASTTVYTIEFVDLAGVLDDYPFVGAKHYINGTLHTVEKRKVDVEKKVIMSLKNGVKYDIIISDGASYTFGDLLMTSTTTVTLTLKGIEFPQNIILAFKIVRLYAERHNNLTSISMVYQDLENDTDHVVCNIKFRNGTVAYTSTQYSNYFNVTWSNANYNITYAVEMDSFHNHYGEINYRAVMYGGHSVAPWSLAFLGSIPGMKTSDLIPLFLIFCVAGIFSKVNAHVGAFLATIMALYLTWLGWISIAPGMLVMALFFAILMGLVAKKRQVTVA